MERRVDHEHTGRPTGRPLTVLTDEEWDRICYLASLDATLLECAAATGVSVATLNRVIAERTQGDFDTFSELKRACGRAELRELMARTANGCHPWAATLQIWLSKQRLGYTDRLPPQGPPAIQISAILVQQLPAQAVIDVASNPQAALLAEASNDKQPSE